MVQLFFELFLQIIWAKQTLQFKMTFWQKFSIILGVKSEHIEHFYKLPEWTKFSR